MKRTRLESGTRTKEEIQVKERNISELALEVEQ